MTDQQTAADHALVECLEAWGPLIASGYECPAAGQRIFEAAERIKSLLAEVERLTVPDFDGGNFVAWETSTLATQCRMQSRDQLDPEYSRFMAELSHRLTELAAENAELRTEQADRQRMREALDYYANDHQCPNDGPWGANSKDFGYVARAALANRGEAGALAKERAE